MNAVIPFSANAEDADFYQEQPSSVDAGQYHLFRPQKLDDISDPNNPKVEDSIESNNDAPVDLEADRVEYDEVKSIVSAVGGVEIIQNGRILQADKVSYNLNKDTVIAEGNVVLKEITGDTYYASTVELKQSMKNGFVRSLHGVFADGSRFTAEEAEKVADVKVLLRKATYTACEPCKADPSKAPVWQIKARDVIHHKDEARVSYKDATFEMAGVPVMYTPYFSHPDGTIKRKSGFLIPKVGFDSTLGTSYSQNYYWSIAENKDATFGLSAFTNVAPMASTEYRHRFENAQVTARGSLTKSDRVDNIAGEEVVTKDEKRGHAFVNGLLNINEKWRAGSDLQLVSDEQYLRQYNISTDDILENKAYIERFDDRDYAVAKIINFRDIRTSDRRVDQPNVLPEVHTSFLGKPNGVLGGRWNANVSALGLQKEGSGQDIGRVSTETGWEKRIISPIGTVSTIDVTGRGDIYNINDRNVATTINQRSETSSSTRAFARAHINNSYPLKRQLKYADLVLEPQVALTAGSDVKENDKIPNEDSQDVSLDYTNIFNANRFPGYDRIEDKTFSTYGISTGVFGHNGYNGELFLGQSYRFDNDTIFPEGSGLSERQSDYVGHLAFDFGNIVDANYSLQLSHDNLESRRHEVDASGRVGRFGLNARYFYANILEGTDLQQSREQIRIGGDYDITDTWSVFSSGHYDLAKENSGLRYATYGISYHGQCVDFMVTGQRTLTRDSSGDSGTTVMMRLGLKNLGEFETSGISVGSQEER